MINSGDAWDLCFTASWGGINFFENAAKGAYADLTDLIPVYAPEPMPEYRKASGTA